MPAVARWFRTIAIIEAVTWACLLVAMFFKYIVDAPHDGGVPIVGPIHGAAFIVYCLSAVVAAWKLRWNLKVTALALLAAFPPLFTVLFERWAGRKGLLVSPTTRLRRNDRAADDARA